MKKLVLLIIGVVGFSFMANAQMANQKTPGQRANHITKVLQKRLNLSNDQAQQVNTAFYTMATRMDSLRSNPAPDRKDNHLAARSIHLAAEQSVVAILNPDQKEQFMAWEKMKKEKEKERHAAAGLKG